MASKSYISFLLSISADEAVERIAALPEIEHGKCLMERNRQGLLIWLREGRSALDQYELTRMELRVTLWTEGADTKVAARIVERPKAKARPEPTIGHSLDKNMAWSLLPDLRDVRKTVARRRKEGIELLNLISRALMPVSIAADESGPYRE